MPLCFLLVYVFYQLGLHKCDVVALLGSELVYFSGTGMRNRYLDRVEFALLRRGLVAHLAC